MKRLRAICLHIIVLSRQNACQGLFLTLLYTSFYYRGYVVDYLFLFRILGLGRVFLKNKFQVSQVTGQI